MTKAGQRLNFIAFLMYFVSIYISETFPGGDFVPVVALGIMLLVYLAENKFRIKMVKSGFLLYMLAFILFCFISRFWSEDPSLSRNKMNGLIFLFVFMVIIYITQINRISIDAILKIIMYGGYAVMLFMVAQYGIGELLSSVVMGIRIGGVEAMNGNTIGMCAAYSAVINLYYIIYKKQFRIMDDILLVIDLIVLLATGSRKAFLIAIGGVCAVFLLKNFNSKKLGQTILKIIGIIVLLGVSLYFILSLPMFSGIMDRIGDMLLAMSGGGTRGSTDGWLRVAYNRLGMELFVENPILGIGIGNANIHTLRMYGHDHYLHNNYIELLATGGIVGTFLYYSIYITIIRIFWKNRKHRDKEYDICLILLLIRLVMDYGAVSYYSKETYIFLFLFWYKALQLKQNQRIPKEVTKNYA